MSRSVTERRALVEPQNSPLSLSRQCQLLALPRSSFYYRPVELDARTIQVMHAMDRICTDHPFYGFRRVQQSPAILELRVSMVNGQDACLNPLRSP